MAGCGSSMAPLFLRLALGVTFLWAGFGKVLETMPVQGERAAALANMGVSLSPPKVGAPKNGAASAQPAPTTPTTPTTAAPAQPPATVPPAAPPTAPEAKEPPADNARAARPLMRLQTEAAPQAATSAAPKKYTAADFPQELTVPRVYGLSLLLTSAANPVPRASDGVTPMPIWPASLVQDRWPVYTAWFVVVSELVGGLFVLVGLLTRISAAFLAGAMAGAMWLTQIGPAIQSGVTWAGFLPRHAPFGFDAAGNYLFTILLWQLALLCAAKALFFLGGGFLSFDRALFPASGGPRRPMPVDAD
ncbi:MAG: DoxX family protein [Phycisphaeraceae bacterium]|nr:DoxX family protein [Phycisphaeraceae bacterium]